jgi:hypothetical protein
MDWLLARPTIVGLAVAGGLLSMVAMVLRRRNGTAVLARRVDIAAYGFMAASMLLFVIVGFRAAG